jgi:erythromycin esterase-like protein
MTNTTLLTGLAGALVLAGCAFSPSSEASEQPTRSAAAMPSPAVISSAAVPLSGSAQDYAPLLAAASGANRVLLGEATHGTAEFYRERARITHQLIRERGFNAVAIEGDWSPTYRVNLYVRGLGKDRSAAEALRGYTNFPQWMWPNSEFRDFVEQLRTFNLTLPANQRVGVYGADVYDLFEAADAVVGHVAQMDPEAARRIRVSYRCFEGQGRDLHRYGQAAQTRAASCQSQAAAVLAEVRKLPKAATAEGEEARFAAFRSAASVAAAEEYFRTLYSGGNSWNARDRRMADNVEAIAAQAASLTGREGRVVMWAHNSHVGDARATSAAERGELNIGQLMRQQHGDRALLVGFFTHSGTVRAASAWGEQHRVFTLNPALPQSHSDLFHRTGVPRFLLMLRNNATLQAQLSTPMLQRAVGVIYVPRAEMQSHYFPASLSRQFDAAVYVDKTEAVKAL